MDFDILNRGMEADAELVETIMDLPTAKYKFSAFEADIRQMENTASGIVVNNRETVGEANELGARAASLVKAIDQQVRKITDPHYRFYKAVLGFGRALAERPKAVQKTVDRKIADYAARIELERREAERKAEEERVRQQAELDKLAAERGVSPVELPKIVVPQDKGPVRSESGTLTIIKFWNFEVTNPGEVPREYLTVDEAKIRQAVQKGGVREIAGVRIYQDQRTQRRTTV